MFSFEKEIVKMFRWSSRALNVVKHCERRLASGVPISSKNDSTLERKDVQSKDPKKSLVAAAFRSLKNSADLGYQREGLDEDIRKAKTPEELLKLSELPGITRQDSQKIVSLLAEWSVKGYMTMTDFESDPRFISLCQTLKATASGQKPSAKQISRLNDLSMVVNIAGEDEASKLVSTMPLPQMIKLLSSMATKKRRSPHLLRTLSSYISSSPEKMDMKQGADVLYALAVLSFPDEPLIKRTCEDLIASIGGCQKTAVIGSIATSLGFLKYKNVEILDALSAWVVANSEIVRPQDISTLLLTLATVNHTPASESFFECILPRLSKDVFPDPLTWLDTVWSLVVLGKANKDHFKSVLSTQFLDWLEPSGGGLSVPTKRKLLNINGAAKWTKGYDGPLLDGPSQSIPLMRSKEKQAFLRVVLETISNLLPSSIYLNVDIDSGMGFLIDGECLIDSKMVPLPVLDRKTGEPFAKPVKGTKNGKKTRVAIMAWDYHDFTRGQSDLCGIASLSAHLATQLGYRVLHVPFTELNPSDKLSVRVSYLENKLKALTRPGLQKK